MIDSVPEARRPPVGGVRAVPGVVDVAAKLVRWSPAVIERNVPLQAMLQEALGIFNEMDIIGAILPKNEELPRLESRHRIVMQFFDKVDNNVIESC